MQNQRLTGPAAGVEKYDLITALAVNGLAAGGGKQTSMMRLIALLTARYNWAADEVTIGQREMAALWAVDERTAKRETRRLIEAGLIEIKRPGIRGRVAAYHVNRQEIYRQSKADWGNVGPDYDARMTALQTSKVEEKPSEAKVVRLDFAPRPAANPKSHPWEKALARLATDQPRLYEAWFGHLQADLPDEDKILHILAPTKFIASYVSSRLMVSLERAVQLSYGHGIRCSVQAQEDRLDPISSLKPMVT